MKKKPAESSTLHVRLPQEVDRLLVLEAKRQGRPKANLAAHLIAQGLKPKDTK